MMHRSVSFVTDRTSTLVAMMRYKGKHPNPIMGCFVGFKAALHMCTLSLVKLLLCVGSVTFYHKQYCESQCQIPANRWGPDILAGFGCNLGEFAVMPPVVNTSFHLLKWSKQEMQKGLLLSITVELESIDEALRFLHCGSYSEFLQKQCPGR